MKLADTRTINAPIADVWAALLTADVLKACVPGCSSLDGNVDEGFTATFVNAWSRKFSYPLTLRRLGSLLTA